MDIFYRPARWGKQKLLGVAPAQSHEYPLASPEVTAALGLANDIRRQQGRIEVSNLEKGIPHDPCFCPIARTINFDATGYDQVVVKNSHDPELIGYVVVSDERFGARTYFRPGALSFMFNFDHGFHSEYIMSDERA